MAKVTSKAEKDLAGTTKNSRVSTPKPPVDITASTIKLPPTFDQPPDYLADLPGADKIFYSLARHCHAAQKLHYVDVFIVGQAAYWLALFAQTIKSAHGDFIQTFDSGAQQISPQFQIIEKCDQKIQKYFDVLGVGMKSREAIDAFLNSQGTESGGDAFTTFFENIEATRILA